MLSCLRKHFLGVEKLDRPQGSQPPSSAFERAFVSLIAQKEDFCPEGLVFDFLSTLDTAGTPYAQVYAVSVT